jgi:hypothetical protein
MNQHGSAVFLLFADVGSIAFKIDTQQHDDGWLVLLLIN